MVSSNRRVFSVAMREQRPNRYPLCVVIVVVVNKTLFHL